MLLALLLLITVQSASLFLPTAQAQITYDFRFSGITNDVLDTQLLFLDGSAALANVTVHSATLGTGFVNSTDSYNYTSTDRPTYVSYDLIDNTTGTGASQHREYWFNTDETNETYVIFGSSSSLTYVLSFLDQISLLKSYPYVCAQIYNLTSATWITVDKRPVDAQNIVAFDLEPYQQYRIVFNDGASDANNIVHGNLTPTATTGIQLIIRGVDFPKETILLYQYVHAFAIRDFLNPIGAITTSYEDTTNQTTSVTITITDADTGAVAYSSVHATVNETFVDSWASAVNATNYEVLIEVVHATYGSFDFEQYLAGEYSKPSEPFSLAFLGSTMGITTSVLIPALLIIFVAGCFSELTAEAAAVLTVIFAIMLTALGFIEITQAALITGLALAVLAGIVAAKRRMF